MEKLFVYGTLAPGRPNEHILKELKGSWEEGIVKGKLMAKGWGSNMGYPGISLHTQEEEVKGFIFSSEQLFSKWKELDAFEGKEYERTCIEVQLNNQKTTHAYIYALK
jgi:gamma-glutamylcyclotransferase (GGCT)/AIG2-like uncharacterized protein YtfP